MSRCLGCGAIMTGAEIGRSKPDNTPEDLCTKCLIAAGVLGGDDEANLEEATTAMDCDCSCNSSVDIPTTP